jgi:arsenate reductase (glutaredoxin)
MVQLYGIPSCDTVKKAKQFLEQNKVPYTFINFKTEPPTNALLKKFIAQLGLETVVNKKGTTWKNLTKQEKAACENKANAIAVLQQHTSLIKRPVFVNGATYAVGFTAEAYAALISTS